MGINNVMVNDVYLLSTRGMSKTEKTSSSNILIQFYQLKALATNPRVSSRETRTSLEDS